MTSAVRALEARDRAAVVALSLRAWAPVFASLDQAELAAVSAHDPQERKEDRLTSPPSAIVPPPPSRLFESYAPVFTLFVVDECQCYEQVQHSHGTTEVVRAPAGGKRRRRRHAGHLEGPRKQDERPGHSSRPAQETNPLTPLPAMTRRDVRLHALEGEPEVWIPVHIGDCRRDVEPSPAHRCLPFWPLGAGIR